MVITKFHGSTFQNVLICHALCLFWMPYYLVWLNDSSSSIVRKEKPLSLFTFLTHIVYPSLACLPSLIFFLSWNAVRCLGYALKIRNSRIFITPTIQLRRRALGAQGKIWVIFVVFCNSFEFVLYGCYNPKPDPMWVKCVINLKYNKRTPSRSPCTLSQFIILPNSHNNHRNVIWSG